MATWIALLRAINLAGVRKFSPKEIVACLESAGFTDVATHINTGNVRLGTTMRSRERIVAAMEAAFLADRGFEVPVALLTTAELAAIAADVPEVARGHDGIHTVSVLMRDPTPETAAALAALDAPGERVVVRGRAVHLLAGATYRGSRMTNTTVERLAGPATNRNARVMSTIATKWC